MSNSATPGLFKYFWQNRMSLENQLFLDEGQGFDEAWGF